MPRIATRQPRTNFLLRQRRKAIKYSTHCSKIINIYFARIINSKKQKVSAGSTLSQF